MLKKLAERIQKDIIAKKTIKIYFDQKSECEIYPRRLVFLDGVLSIVGEDVSCKALEFFPLTRINHIDESLKLFNPNLSQFQVNEFINEIRSINGKQERLILKFHAQDGEDLLLKYHYLHNPYVTANSEGDLIWAATIEMCDEIYLWLYEMRDKVEVLDPGFVRKQFSKFCENRKAS